MQAFNTYTSLVQNNRGRIQRTFFVCALIILSYYLSAGLLISQTGVNPLRYQEVDPTYWMFMIFNIPEIVSGNVAVVFDVVLFATAIGSALLPTRFIFPLIFFVCYFIYFILYNMSSGHHYGNVGLLMVGFSFIFPTRYFGYSFNYSRFAFLFIMFTAAVWKIWRGNLTYPHQMEMIMIVTNPDLMVTGAKTILQGVRQWLIGHSAVSHSIWIFLIALEFYFVAGFFTYRRDWLLLILYVLFFIGGWFLTGMYNFENILFLLTLYPVVKLISTPDER